MRGGGGRFYGGRGSVRGSTSGQFRTSSNSMGGYRMDSSYRRGGGGNRFQENFYNGNRSSGGGANNNYSSYNRRNHSAERNSRATDKLKNRRDASPPRPTYRATQRDRSYDGAKRMRENGQQQQQQRRLSSTRVRGNRTPPSPSPPTNSYNARNHQRRSCSSDFHQSQHGQQHHHRPQRPRVAIQDNNYTTRMSARARLSLKSNDLRYVRRRMTIYTAQQKEIGARSRKFRLTSQLQQRRRLQRSKTADADAKNARNSVSPKRPASADKMEDTSATRKRKVSTPPKRSVKVRRSNSANKDSNDEVEKVSLDKMDAKKDKSKENGTAAVTEQETVEKIDKEKEKQQQQQQSPTLKNEAKEQRVTKLTCVHCHTKCYSFKQYTEHFYFNKHKKAFMQISRRQRAYLLRLRARQRAAQREIDEGSKEDIQSQYCALCRLHYRLQTAKHQLSEHHLAMKKFLLPYCAICRISFTSPMSYEVHRCSVEHLRQKMNRSTENSGSEAELDTHKIDLNNFLTVDSVGKIDGDLNAEAEENFDDDDVKENGNGQEQILDKTGAKYVKLVQAFYCELCDTYCAAIANDDLPAYAASHCEEVQHKLNFRQLQLEKNMEEEEEKKQKAAKEDMPNNDDQVDREDGETPAEQKLKENNEHDRNEPSDTDEKLWADVDKDIGDIFASVQTTIRDEDEEYESVLNIDLESDMLTNQEKKSKVTTTGSPPTVENISTAAATTTATDKNDENITINDENLQQNEAKTTTSSSATKRVKLTRSSKTSKK